MLVFQLKRRFLSRTLEAYPSVYRVTITDVASVFACKLAFQLRIAVSTLRKKVGMLVVGMWERFSFEIPTSSSEAVKRTALLADVDPAFVTGQDVALVASK